MCENVNEKLELTGKDFKIIYTEVLDLLGMDKRIFLDPLFPRSGHNTKALNTKLEEIFHYVTCYPTDELTAWLRYSGNWKDQLPAWLPLLKVSYQQAQTRNEPAIAARLFMGLTKYLEDDNDKTNDR